MGDRGSAAAGLGAKYLVARLRGGDVAAISSSADGAVEPPAWNTYIWVDSADETATKSPTGGRSRGKGAVRRLRGRADGRVCRSVGAAFSVWQAKEHRGARIVNEPGALTFNGLETRDLEGAAAFYAAVFGWRTFDLPAGKTWTLPSYGDYLEELTPGIRARTAEFGVPGFEDVVAAITPIARDDPDSPAQWSVTFSTDDADATAAKAAELGGTVIAAPIDAAVLATDRAPRPTGSDVLRNAFVLENKDVGREAM